MMIVTHNADSNGRVGAQLLGLLLKGGNGSASPADDSSHARRWNVQGDGQLRHGKSGQPFHITTTISTGTVGRCHGDNLVLSCRRDLLLLVPFVKGLELATHGETSRSSPGFVPSSANESWQSKMVKSGEKATFVNFHPPFNDDLPLFTTAFRAFVN